jgi:hypothetical protein
MGKSSYHSAEGRHSRLSRWLRHFLECGTASYRSQSGGFAAALQKMIARLRGDEERT